MGQYAVRRVIGGIPIILIILLVVFFLVRLVPGSPINALLPDGATPQQVQQLTAQLGLNQPIYVQFGKYLVNAVQLNFGTSILYSEPVRTLIGQRLPATFELAIAASIVAVALGVPLGILSARWHGRWADRVATAVGLIGISAPPFWIGLLLIIYVAGGTHAFPTGGQLPSTLVDPGPTNFVLLDMLLHGNLSGAGTTLQYLALPAVTLGAAMAGLLVRMTRSSLLEVAGEDFVRTARAKGAAERRVVLRHSLRNALMPIVTIFGLEVANVLAGSIIVETVFAWPGMGNLLVGAVNGRDYPVVEGVVLVYAVIFVVMNLIVDLSYHKLDPRIR
jgi:peptide/nickel transport system permease protein